MNTMTQHLIETMATTTDINFQGPQLYITTSPSGKFYVGVTKRSFKTRYLSNNTFHAHTRAVKKYGVENMNAIIIPCFTIERAYSLEALCVSWAEVIDLNCYNHKLGGGTTITWSPEAQDRAAFKMSGGKIHFITDPRGTVHEVVNVTKFCREHDLYQGSFAHVISGKVKDMRGYSTAYSTKCHHERLAYREASRRAVAAKELIYRKSVCVTLVKDGVAVSFPRAKEACDFTGIGKGGMSALVLGDINTCYGWELLEEHPKATARKLKMTVQKAHVEAIKMYKTFLVQLRKSHNEANKMNKTFDVQARKALRLAKGGKV